MFLQVDLYSDLRVRGKSFQCDPFKEAPLYSETSIIFVKTLHLRPYMGTGLSGPDRARPAASPGTHLL